MKKNETLFSLPDFPLPPSQFTANGFVKSDDKEPSTETSNGKPASNGELRSPRTKPARKGKR